MLETARACRRAGGEFLQWPVERDALITGIGLVSCLGAGEDAHWAALNELPPGGGCDDASPPLPVHPMAPLELDKQIPKRGDQRQMEAWQRIGVYAAGLALDPPA